MKSLFTVLIGLILFTAASAQYNKPYRVAYNSDKKSFLITNNGAGSVVELDSNFKTTTVITGLTAPKDIAFGSFGGNSGILIIDNNKIVVYDASTYQKYTSLTVSGVTELEDIEFDLNNVGYFYLSDVGGNAIIRGKVGPPPFYLPSYTKIVSSGITRPKGLHFNNNGDLIVVTDETNGKIIKVDTASGSLTTLLSTNIDSLNSIAQDPQGNYFFTNWDDSYLYRCDKNFGNLTKITGYNKPAGLSIVPELDIVAILCHLCNKIEFHRLHYFEVASSTGACAGSSFITDFSIFADGKGTYNAGNKFIVELSDSTGSFAKSTTLGSTSATSNPKSISCSLPIGKYATNGYKYRIRTTNPVFVSPEESFDIYATPIAADLVYNDLSLCKGSTASMGKSGSSNDTYSWSSSMFLSDSTISNPIFSATDTGTYSYQFKATNKSFGCSDSVIVNVSVSPNIQLKSLIRNNKICNGESLEIGVKNSPYSFNWSPQTNLSNPTISNPVFSGISNQKYTVDIEDKNTGCKGYDSVYIIVNPVPTFSISNSYTKICSGKTAQLTASNIAGISYSWSPGNVLSDSTIFNPIFQSNISGDYHFIATATHPLGCTYSQNARIFNAPVPTTNNLKLSAQIFPSVLITGTINSADDIDFYFTDSAKNQFTFNSKVADVPGVVQLSDTSSKNIYAYLAMSHDSGCSAVSDIFHLVWTTNSIADFWESQVSLYPNPATNFVLFSGDMAVKNIEILDVFGRQIKSEIPNGLIYGFDVSDLETGNYFIVFEDDLGNKFWSKLQKL